MGLLNLSFCRYNQRKKVSTIRKLIHLVIKIKSKVEI
nr:MAG TPA: hypothetical protein [Caudoviricetes sp.]